MCKNPFLFCHFTETKRHDPRTLTFLENALAGIALPAQTTYYLATLLVPREVVRDEISAMAAQIEASSNTADSGGLFPGGLKREGTQTSLRSGNGSSASGEDVASPHSIAKAVFFKVGLF